MGAEQTTGKMNNLSRHISALADFTADTRQGGALGEFSSEVPEKFMLPAWTERITAECKVRGREKHKSVHCGL